MAAGLGRGTRARGAGNPRQTHRINEAGDAVHRWGSPPAWRMCRVIGAWFPVVVRRPGLALNNIGITAGPVTARRSEP